jgi:hypothetical protein
MPHAPRCIRPPHQPPPLRHRPTTVSPPPATTRTPREPPPPIAAPTANPSNPPAPRRARPTRFPPAPVRIAPRTSASGNRTAATRPGQSQPSNARRPPQRVHPENRRRRISQRPSGRRHHPHAPLPPDPRSPRSAPSTVNLAARPNRSRSQAAPDQPATPPPNAIPPRMSFRRLAAATRRRYIARLGRSVAQPGRALCSGRRGRRFESSHSDQPHQQPSAPRPPQDGPPADQPSPSMWPITPKSAIRTANQAAPQRHRQREAPR